MKIIMNLSIAILAALITAYTPFASAVSAATNMQLSIDAVNSPTPADPAGQAALLRAQILLDRAHFSPGEIDARFGGNMRNAIIAYQS